MMVLDGSRDSRLAFAVSYNSSVNIPNETNPRSRKKNCVVDPKTTAVAKLENSQSGVSDDDDDMVGYSFFVSLYYLLCNSLDFILTDIRMHLLLLSES